MFLLFRLNVSPYAAHATYSLDNHDGVAKRQRFRETGLWLAGRNRIKYSSALRSAFVV